MSASDKKKQRKAQQNEQLTAKQRQEQAEAKKLKAYTIAFIAVIVIDAVSAIFLLGHRIITGSGVLEKNTVAATINGQEINSVDMNYYYNDAINRLFETYSSITSDYETIAQLIDLDMYKPLDQQSNPSTGELWSTYILNAALEQAEYDYTFAALAEKAGFTLPTETQEDIDLQISSLEATAQLAQFPNTDKYLARVYCAGASVDSYKAYLTRNALADAYCEHYYTNELKIEQTDIDAHVEGKENEYTSFDYSYVYVSYESFLAEDVDSTSATAEQKEPAAAEAKKLAEELAALTTLDDIRDKVNEIEDTEIVVKDLTAQLYTAVPNAKMAEWLVAAERTPGEITLIANAQEDDPTPYGFYVVCFTSKNDNTGKMSNVRHLLVAFEGGKEDEISGEMVYSQAEKDTAKAKAEELLQQWKDGEADEASFITLVKKETDDTASADNGGLYENINPASQYVENFLDWAINPERKAEDVGIIETEYGYHIMYFSGYSEQSYRDQMVSEELKSTKYETWFDATLEAATTVTGNTSRLPLDKPIYE